MLLAGIASTILVASKAADTSSPTTRAIESAVIVHQIATELNRAKLILAHEAHLLDFIADDVNGDGVEDRIRYERLGGTGNTLTRRINQGPVTTISNRVANLEFVLRSASLTSDHSATTRSTPSLRASHESLAAPIEVVIDSNQHVSQFISPDEFAPPLPTAANGWAVHAVSLRMSQSDVVDGSLDIEIRTADSAGKPTSLVLASKSILESDLPPTVDWVTILFDLPTAGLNPSSGICIVCKHVSGVESARIQIDSTSIGGVSASDNAGATWQHSGDDRLAFRRTSSHTEQVDTTLDQKFAQSYFVALEQVGSPQLTRAGSFETKPQLVKNVFEAQFNSDPTTLDSNRDGADDWTVDSGVIGGITDGLWQASAGRKLQLANPQNLTSAVCIEFSCRSTQPVGDGAVLFVEADWQAGTTVPLCAKITRTTNDTQILRLLTEEWGVERTLFQMKDLPDRMLTIRMTIDPQQDQVHLALDESELGTFRYTPQTQPGGSPRLYLTNDIGTVEFGHVSVRIAEDSP